MLPSRRGRGTTLHLQTTNALRDIVVSETFAAGDRLVEADLCRRLAVSRTPLREALKVLAAEGLIEILPNRGAIVARTTAAETLALFEVVATLEGLAAELAARTMSDDDLDALAHLHAELRTRFVARNRRAYFDLNHRIHRAIVAAAGNPVLAETHERLLARARRGRYLALSSADRWEEAMDEHEALMDALVARKARLAGRLLRRHTLRTGAVMAAIAEGDAASTRPPARSASGSSPTSKAEHHRPNTSAATRKVLA